jgi:hypothetical protein
MVGTMSRELWHICLVRPQGYLHSSVFEDVAESLSYALLSLGKMVSFAENGLNPSATNVVLAPHLLRPSHVPDLKKHSVILYNFEQLPTQLAMWKEYRDILMQFPIWDYQESNVRWLTTEGHERARYVPYGWTARLTRLPPRGMACDIDVLLIGSLTPRRQAVLDRLRLSGLRVVHAFGVYGLARDLLLARTRLILNCHSFTPNDPLEEMRLLYAWANGKPVVAETAAMETVPETFRDAALWSDYEGLPAACTRVLADEALAERLATRGLQVAQQRDDTQIVARALED